MSLSYSACIHISCIQMYGSLHSTGSRAVSFVDELELNEPEKQPFQVNSCITVMCRGSVNDLL